MKNEGTFVPELLKHPLETHHISNSWQSRGKHSDDLFITWTFFGSNLCMNGSAKDKTGENVSFCCTNSSLFNSCAATLENFRRIINGKGVYEYSRSNKPFLHRIWGSCKPFSRWWVISGTEKEFLLDGKFVNLQNFFQCMKIYYFDSDTDRKEMLLMFCWCEEYIEEKVIVQCKKDFLFTWYGWYECMIEFSRLQTL